VHEGDTPFVTYVDLAPKVEYREILDVLKSGYVRTSESALAEEALKTALPERHKRYLQHVRPAHGKHRPA
jgi:hypothetical protein